MAAIANLSVSLTARTAGFRKGMRNARTGVRGFAKDIASVTIKVAKFAAVMATAAVGGLVLMVKRALTTVDALAKVADKIGITTEALAGLRHGAKLSGIATNTLDMALQRFARRLSEAAAETGEAQAAIKELGLDARALATMPLEKRLEAVADAMKGSSTAADRLRLAFKLFDSEGVALVNLLKGGSKGLQEFRKEAERFGLTISRLDASRIEKANNAFVRMKALAEGMFQQLAVQMAPFLEALADRFVEVGLAGGNAGARVAEGWGMAIRVLAKVADWLEVIRIGWHGMFVSARLAILGITGTLSLLSGSPVLAELNKILKDEIGKSVDDLNKSLERFSQGAWTKDLEAFLKRLNDDIAEMRTGVGSLNALGAKQQQFKQIRLSTQFVGGVSGTREKEQKVKDAALEKTNKLLREIRDKLGGVASAVTT